MEETEIPAPAPPESQETTPEPQVTPETEVPPAEEKGPTESPAPEPLDGSGPTTEEPAPEPEKTPELEPNQNLLEAQFLENAAVANFIVDAIESNGAFEEQNKGYTLRLKAHETDETKEFFKSIPSVLYIGVCSPKIAEKFKVGGRVSLVLLNED